MNKNDERHRKITVQQKAFKTIYHALGNSKTINLAI